MWPTAQGERAAQSKWDHRTSGVGTVLLCTNWSLPSTRSRYTSSVPSRNAANRSRPNDERPASPVDLHVDPEGVVSVIVTVIFCFVPSVGPAAKYVDRAGVAVFHPAAERDDIAIPRDGVRSPATELRCPSCWYSARDELRGAIPTWTSSCDRHGWRQCHRHRRKSRPRQRPSSCRPGSRRS